MVNSLSGTSHANPLSSVANRLGVAADIAPVDNAAKAIKPATLLQTLDTAEDSAQYSATSLDKAIQEQDALKFGRQVQRMAQPYNSERVAELKAKFSTPEGVTSYLNQVDWNATAGNLLNTVPGLV